MYFQSNVANSLYVVIILALTLVFGLSNFQVNAQVGTVKTEQKISGVTNELSNWLNDFDFFGSSVADIGDINSDGLQEIAVGIRGNDEGGNNRGAVYILTLNNDNTVSILSIISSIRNRMPGSLDNDDLFGASIANIGDINGDGVTDIAVGAFQDDDGGNNYGAVYILMLNADGSVNTKQKISQTSGNFAGPLDDFDRFGHSVSGIGDLDSDGIPDIAVGAHLDGDGGNQRGAVYILTLNANGTVKSEQKISSTSGNFNGFLNDRDRLGTSIASIGDLDQDGINDIAVGADLDGAGTVYLLTLNVNGSVKSVQEISSTEGGLTGPLQSSDLFGSAITNIGDIDGDGIIDIAVGASQDDDGATFAGAVYILTLNANGTVKSEQKISSTNGGLVSSLDSSDYFGHSLANIGDYDNDGIEDIVAGAYLDDDKENGAGAVYILTLNGPTAPNISISQSDGSTTITEDGATDTIDYILDTEPTSNVQIILEANPQLDYGSGVFADHLVTFTPTNWDTPQSVTVTAADDNLIEGNHISEVSHDVSSTDTDYGSLAIADIPVQITDNDVAEVSISPEAITVLEDNGVNNFDVVLEAQPDSDVVIEITSLNTDEATVSPDSLTFTDTDWDTPQTVTVTGVDDIIESTDTVQISISVDDSASDDNFDGLTGQVEVTLTDNDQDTDSDDVPDAVEGDENSNPNDSFDYLDSDRDLVPDYVEGIQQTDSSDPSDFQDSDSGGTPDYVEEVYFPNIGLGATSANEGSDDSRDLDGDTLADYTELLNGTQPTNPDDDGDGIPTQDELEVSRGDTNGDGIADYGQSNISVVRNPYIEENVTLVATGECTTITDFIFVAESELDVADETSNYLFGLHDFTLECPTTGQSVMVEVIWPTLPQGTDQVYKKFDGVQFVNITENVVIDTKTINGEEKVVVSYEITDGGELDADKTMNGSITDPAGPATPRSEISLIRTGGVDNHHL